MSSMLSIPEFIQTIESGKLPFNVSVFSGNCTDLEIQKLSSILCSGQYCSHLSFFLGNSQITDTGMSDLAKVLTSGKILTMLALNLWKNNLGISGIRSLAKALASGKAPTDLYLNLGMNNLDDECAVVLAQALASGKAPNHLTLNLWNNKITGLGARSLAVALTSGHSPSHLRLSLRSNLMDSASAIVFINFLLDHAIPKGLQIHLDDDLSNPYLHTLSREADEAYEELRVWMHEQDPLNVDTLILLSQGIPPLSADALFSIAIRRYQVMEAFGMDTQSKQAKIYCLYFENQLQGFIMGSRQFANEQEKLEQLNDLLKEFKLILPLFKDEATDSGSSLMQMFALAYSSLNQHAEKYQCWFDAIKLCHSAEERLRCESIYTRVIENDKKKSTSAVNRWIASGVINQLRRWPALTERPTDPLNPSQRMSPPRYKT